MCLIALAYKVHPAYPLIVVANRDEFLDRPAAAATFWSESPHILAGRDLKAGGTWMGVTRSGRFAALTNHRDLRRKAVAGPSRGQLVLKALEEGLDHVDPTVYEGFNLIYGPMDALRYCNNVDGTDHELAPGVHGLSNAVLDTPWPKVQRAKRLLQEWMDDRTSSIGSLFELLLDGKKAPDDQLPDTGVGMEWERTLSSILIRAEGYGTRCSTVVTLDKDGLVSFEERTHDAAGEVRESFMIAAGEKMQGGTQHLGDTLR